VKIFVYAMREFDELGAAEKWSREYGIEFGWSAEYPTAGNVELARGSDAVSVTPCDMGAAMLERFRAVGVRYITARSIGYEHIDLRRAKELGMRVSNTAYGPDGVANYAIMLMMMCLRKMPHIMKRAEVQDYSLKGKLGRDISSCTVGVVGTGRIGATVVKNLSAFGCRVLANDLFPKAELPCRYVGLDELWRESDVITIHTPATPESFHLVDAKAIAAMKDGVILVNCARGAMIDTDALIDALESGRVGGAALDVLEHENGLYYYDRMGDVIRNRRMAILRAFPNVLLSPHTAFYTDENVDNMMKYNFDSLRRFENGLDDPREIRL